MAFGPTIVLNGNLGRDPETRPAGSTTVTEFSVAQSFGRNKAPEWFKVSVWGKRGETAAQYLRKGSAVIVTGALSVDRWQGHDDTERFTLCVEAYDWRFGGSSVSRGPHPPDDGAVVEEEEEPISGW